MSNSTQNDYKAQVVRLVNESAKDMKKVSDKAKEIRNSTKNDWAKWKENFLQHISKWSYFSADEELEKGKGILLADARKEMEGKVKKMKKKESYEKYCGCDGECFASCDASYNKALDDVLATLREEGGEMRIKKIKSIIERIYARGFHDGVDVVRGSRDRFFGDREARKRHEEETLRLYYKELKEVVNES